MPTDIYLSNATAEVQSSSEVTVKSPVLFSTY